MLLATVCIELYPAIDGHFVVYIVRREQGATKVDLCSWRVIVDGLGLFRAKFVVAKQDTILLKAAP